MLFTKEDGPAVGQRVNAECIRIPKKKKKSEEQKKKRRSRIRWKKKLRAHPVDKEVLASARRVDSAAAFSPGLPIQEGFAAKQRE